MNIKESNLRVHGLMLLCTFLISSSFPVGAAITSGLPPSVLMLIRFALAVLFFLPYIYLKHGIKKLERTDTLRYLGLSLPLAIFFWCMFEGLRYTNALNTGALFTLIPSITALWAFFLLKEKPKALRLTGLLLGCCGALWINFRGSISHILAFQFNKGDLIFLIGCMAFALYNVLVKRLHRGEPMAIMTFWTLVFGSLWMFILSSSQLTQIQWAEVGLNIYGGIAYLAFFTTLCTFFLAQYCILRIGAIKVSAYTYLTPVFVILIQSFLKAPPIMSLLPGIVLISSAVFLVQVEVKSKIDSY